MATLSPSAPLTPRRRALRPGQWAAWLPRLGLAVVVLGLVAYPVARLALQTFGIGNGGLSIDAYRQAFGTPTFGKAVVGSLLLTLASLVIGTPIAVALAWVTCRTDAPLARHVAALPVISLAVSPLVGAIGWLFLLSPRTGLINVLVRSAAGSSATSGPFNAYSIPVIVLVLSLYIVSYIYAPVYAALRRADGSLEEAARVSGSGTASVFWRVTLPMLRPAILAGTLIGAVMAASMFAIPLVLSSGTGLQVIPVLIYQFMNSTNQPEAATAVASILSVITVGGMVLSTWALRRGSYATISAKGRGTATVALGKWRVLASGFVVLFLLLSLGLPVIGLVVLSLLEGWSGSLSGLHVTLAQYSQAFDFPNARAGLVNSAWLSAVATTVALALGFALAYLRARLSPRLGRVMSSVGTLPIGIPGIVLGLAVLIAFSGRPFSLYGTAWIMIIGYVGLVLPVAVRNMEAALRQVSPELEEAALTVGDTRMGLIRRVLLPLLREGLLSTWGLMFLMLYRDLNLSILLYSLGTSVSSVSLIGIYGQATIGQAAAYAIAMTLVSGLVAFVVVWLSGRGSLGGARARFRSR